MMGHILSNGVTIPSVGLGTWRTPNGDTAVNAVKYALECGYRHIDTAQGYGNEESVGRAVRESGIARGDIFVTTKLANDKQGYESALAAYDESLRVSGLDYFDLLLIHWPCPKPTREIWKEKIADTWRAFEKLYNDGKVRAIGVSNFRKHHLDHVFSVASIKPMVNQIEIHPGFTQKSVADYSKKLGMAVEAWSPLSSGEIFEKKEMLDIAAKYGATVAQVCISWSLAGGYIPLPKSVTPSRIAENFAVKENFLSQEDISLISSLTDCGGMCLDPDA